MMRSTTAVRPTSAPMQCMLLWIFISSCFMRDVADGFHLQSLPPPSSTKAAFRGSSRTNNRIQRRKLELNLVAEKIEKTEAQWKEILSPDEFYVLREEGTEPPNSSPLNDVKDPGTFTCAGCGNPLFTTSTKFDSGTGWPSFYAPIDSVAVETSTDYKLIVPRTECHCASCGGHLGHVFDDGPEPTGQRFCMNGVSMKFATDEERPDLAVSVSERQATSTPFTPPASQVLPGAIINGVIGGLFFAQFVSGMEQNAATGGGLSPLSFFPLLPAVYYGVLAVNTMRRLL